MVLSLVPRHERISSVVQQLVLLLHTHGNLYDLPNNYQLICLNLNCSISISRGLIGISSKIVEEHNPMQKFAAVAVNKQVHFDISNRLLVWGLLFIN